MSRFLTPLKVEEVDEFEGTWKLTEPLAFQSDALGTTVVVPFGFVTDFASVPRILVIYDLVGGKCNKAAVVHDWLYTTQQVDRQAADRVLAEAIQASGYSAFTASVFYAAVRVGGGSHWTAPNLPQPAPVQQAIDAASLVAP